MSRLVSDVIRRHVSMTRPSSSDGGWPVPDVAVGVRGELAGDEDEPSRQAGDVAVPESARVVQAVRIDDWCVTFCHTIHPRL
jgi:hypothetical protein